jgi:FkbH-like protein
MTSLASPILMTSKGASMKTADFLFPKDLEVTPTKLNKVLFIGSCLSRDYVIKFRNMHQSVTYDYILFNNAADLPDKSTEQINDYDFQYIQLPLRSVLTDAIIRIADNDSADSPIDWIELGKHNIDAMLEKAMSYNSQANLLTFVSNFIVPQGRISPSLSEQDTDTDLVRIIRELNHHLSQRLIEFKNTYLADVDMIANSIGKKYFLDDAIVFYTHGSLFYTDWSAHERTPYWTEPGPGRIEVIPNLGETYENKNEEFFEAVHRQMVALYRTTLQVDMVKLVIFDLDNTLWRGQLIEHYQPEAKWPYSDGWPLGLWEAVHHLTRRGIIVSIASKNDEMLVINKWDDAVQPRFINFSDFLQPKINWNPKSENIRELMTELSLTPASIVLVDDNPVERESVRAALPSIRVIGSDPFVVRRILLWSPETQLPIRSDESKRRSDMLKNQIDREISKGQMSRTDFLNSLQSQVLLWEIGTTTHGSFPRALELVNKTNQFNTNGRRWTFEECQKHLVSLGRIFAFSVRDKYADYGTVGVIFVEGSDISQFVMSCRVLGMDIETAVLSELISVLRIENRTEISGSITPTETNTPCRQLYLNCGFTEIQGTYVLSSSISVTRPDHVSTQLIN